MRSSCPCRLSPVTSESTSETVLEPFFEWLAAQPSFRITVRDRLRIARMLRAEADWTIDRLEAGLGSLLARDPEQLADFRRNFHHFFAVASLPELRPRPLDRGKLIAALKGLETQPAAQPVTRRAVTPQRDSQDVDRAVHPSLVDVCIRPATVFRLREIDWPIPQPSSPSVPVAADGTV